MALKHVIRLQSTVYRGIFTSSRLNVMDGPDEYLPPLKLATGLEKKEMIAYQKGNEDPYHISSIKRVRNSTRDKPTMIPSAFDERYVGCLCEEESIFINWMWLPKGEPKRCMCGHWFQLVYKEPL